jgi:hypothetical protein
MEIQAEEFRGFNLRAASNRGLHKEPFVLVAKPFEESNVVDPDPVCFRASRIWILPSTSEKSKNLISTYYFVTSF